MPVSKKQITGTFDNKLNVDRLFSALERIYSEMTGCECKCVSVVRKEAEVEEV